MGRTDPTTAAAERACSMWMLLEHSLSSAVTVAERTMTTTSHAKRAPTMLRSREPRDYAAETVFENRLSSASGTGHKRQEWWKAGTVFGNRRSCSGHKKCAGAIEWNALGASLQLGRLGAVEKHQDFFSAKLAIHVRVIRFAGSGINNPAFPQPS